MQRSLYEMDIENSINRAKMKAKQLATLKEKQGAKQLKSNVVSKT